MYIYIYMCIYIYTYTHTYVYIYTYTHICVYIYIYTHVCIYGPLCMCVCVYMKQNTHICVYMNIYARVCVYISRFRSRSIYIKQNSANQSIVAVAWEQIAPTTKEKKEIPVGTPPTSRGFMMWSRSATRCHSVGIASPTKEMDCCWGFYFRVMIQLSLRKLKNLIPLTLNSIIINRTGVLGWCSNVRIYSIPTHVLWCRVSQSMVSKEACYY